MSSKQEYVPRWYVTWCEPTAIDADGGEQDPVLHDQVIEKYVEMIKCFEM